MTEHFESKNVVRPITKKEALEGTPSQDEINRCCTMINDCLSTRYRYFQGGRPLLIDLGHENFGIEVVTACAQLYRSEWGVRQQEYILFFT